MTARALLLAALLVPALAGGALAQQGRGGHRIEDFAGLWAAQPGGQAGVEIRVSGARIVARELFNSSGSGRCGTEGRGRWTGRTSHLNFRGRCADGRHTPDTRCAVTVEAPDRLSSRCANGHRMTLYRVGG